MNTISASASPMRHGHPITLRQVAHTLGNLIAPRDHAGKGNWSDDTNIPWQAWPGALAVTAFILFGPQALGWLLRFVL